MNLDKKWSSVLLGGALFYSMFKLLSYDWYYLFFPFLPSKKPKGPDEPARKKTQRDW